MKIPCIKCDEKMWAYIKPYLEKWRYRIYVSNSWEICSLLTINYGGEVGGCNNYPISHLQCYNRELVTDVEEFLEKAATLKGFTYKRKIMEINGIEIKPGMVITTANDIAYIAFPTKEGMSFINTSRGSWYKNTPDNIVKIRDLSEGGRIDNGTILWEKPKEVVITMDEIAKKFGVPVEQLKIKK